VRFRIFQIGGNIAHKYIFVQIKTPGRSLRQRHLFSNQICHGPSKVYQLDAATIAPKLLSLMALPNVTAPDARWLAEAIQFYRTKNSDFGDALLCAFAQHQGCDVATFDKGILKKFPEVPAYTPIDWRAGKAPKRVKDQN
jgi:hypothetical protein